MRATRVLIVDDDPAALVAFRETLRLRMPEVQVDVAESGTQALQHLDQIDFDAVVSDIKMPGMDGLTLLTEIRNRKLEVPTLLITGHGQHDLAVRALRGGAFDFIQKPIDRDYIVVALSRAFEVRNLRRQLETQQRTLQEHAANLEIAVEQRTRELMRADRAKDEFLAMLAHELRNPLASISTAASLMTLCDGDSEPHDEALDVIQKQVVHMTRLLDDLLDVSRITRNRITLRKERIDLVRVLETTVHNVRKMFEESGHRFSTQIPNESLWVDGDPTRLEQVFANLINNAFKYTDPGGNIHLRVCREGYEAVVAVEDNGIGITPEMLPLIFELFTQADRSLDRSQGGLGIGLTLVQKLVEFHGGQVHATSEGEGMGSRFVVRLPLTDAPVVALGEPVAPSQQDLPCRVLIVDDDPSIALMTSKLLKRCGHAVVAVASDGPSALEAVYHHAPEVVLLDIGLPKINGYEVARQLRRNPELRNLILVAMTGYGRDQDRRNSFEAGFDHHMVKPVTLDALQAILTKREASVPACRPTSF